MTAISIWNDYQTASSYLLTDGAAFRMPTGEIMSRGPKVLMLASVRIAVAVSGRAGPHDLLKAWNDTAISGTQFGLLDSLPDALRLCFKRRVGRERDDAVRVWVAMFDGERREPRCFGIGTDGIPWIEGVEPYQLHETEGQQTPPIDPCILPDGMISDPRNDGRRMIRAQRDYQFPHLGMRCGVGGDCTLYRVSADGIACEDVVRFPEIEGEFADSSIAGIDVHELPTIAA